jgi:hypothetical protein
MDYVTQGIPAMTGGNYLGTFDDGQSRNARGAMGRFNGLLGLELMFPRVSY